MKQLISAIGPQPESLTSKESIEWYKTLDLNQRINLKECCILLTGIEYHDLTKLFSLREVIKLLYNKLKMEGFDV